MPKDFFRFKKFTIRQDRCAMKVSTDACLLGAWAPLEEISGKVLDIGAGTGLLSLMLAQRFGELKITALEIDPEAATQAGENVAESPFADRIEVVCEDIRAHHPTTLYDAIIANPPFFQNSLKGPDAARNAARHSDALSLEDLYASVVRFLKPDGLFALLLPVEAQKAWEKGLISGKLSLRERVFVKPLPYKAPNRVLSLYGKGENSGNASNSELVIYEEYGTYTAAFRKLLAPFYLHL